MLLIGQHTLQRFQKRHADARPWVARWVDVVESSDWQSLADVRQAYPHADGVSVPSGTVVTVFNCHANAYRLLTLIVYATGTVLVLDVLTHAEYSKDLWKARH